MREQRDALTGGALAAGIVGHAFAIGGLREQARQREFSDSTGSREEQRVRNTIGSKSAAQRADEAFITEKFGEPHTLASLARRCGRKHAFDGGENVYGNFLGLANGILRGVETLDGGPGNASGERVVHFSGVFQMAQAGLQNIFLRGSVSARGL